MAWNPSPKVADLRELAQKWGCDQIVVLAINTTDETFETVSYGKTRTLCISAKNINEQIHKEVLTGTIEIAT